MILYRNLFNRNNLRTFHKLGKNVRLVHFATSVCKYNDKNVHHKRCNELAGINFSSTRKISQSFYDSYLSLDAPPIKMVYTFLDTIHNYTGLPWWASILSATFIMRTSLTLPVFVLTAKNNEKLARITPLVKKLSNELKVEVSRAQKEFKWDAKMAYHHYRWNMKRIVNKLYVEENCHPGKNFILPWIQLPIWISTSLALRNMSGMFQVDGKIIPAQCPDLAVEGVLWFPNLLTPDMILLPIIIFLSNTIIVELHNRGVKEKTQLSKLLTYTFRGINLIMLPISATVPSCLSFYWACSSVYGLLQNIIVRNIMKGRQVDTKLPDNIKVELYKKLKPKK